MPVPVPPRAQIPAKSFSEVNGGNHAPFEVSLHFVNEKQGDSVTLTLAPN